LYKDKRNLKRKRKEEKRMIALNKKKNMNKFRK